MADSNSTAAAAPAKPMPVVGGGDASGVSILLANHHSYGLAERCWCVRVKLSWQSFMLTYFDRLLLPCPWPHSVIISN